MRLSRRHLLAVPVAGPLLSHSQGIALGPLRTGRDEDVLPAAFDLVPATAIDADREYGIIVDLADLALEMAHTGVVRPESLDEGDPDRGAFLRMLTTVSATGATVIQYALAEDWRALHGFDIRDIDQIVHYGQPPDRVTILRGRFDLNGVRAALTDQGYVSTELDGVEVMNAGADYDVALDPETISRFWFSQGQNIALLDPGTLVFAAATGLIETVIRVQAGDDDSLVADDRLTALFPSSAGPMTTAIVMDGRGVSAERFTGRSGTAETDDVPLLPRVESAVFGATPGGVVTGPDEPSEPSVAYTVGEGQIRLLFADADVAAEGRDAIRARLASGSSVTSGRPWSDLFGETDVEHVDDTPLVILHLPDWIPGRRSVIELVFQDDLGFLLWG